MKQKYIDKLNTIKEIFKNDSEIDVKNKLLLYVEMLTTMNIKNKSS